MARLMLIGEHCEVQLFAPGESPDHRDEEESWTAECSRHGLIDYYDTLNDAIKYAQDHADSGRQK